MHTCEHEGWLVPSAGRVPTDPTEFAGAQAQPGCSRLGCPYCGAHVKNRPGWTLRTSKQPSGKEGRAAIWALYEAESWTPNEWLLPDPGSRLWLCRCTAIPCAERTPIRRSDREPLDPYRGRAAPWGCQGHPEQTLPFDWGRHIADTGALRARAREVFERSDPDDLEFLRTLPARGTPEIAAEVFAATAAALADLRDPTALRTALSVAVLYEPPAVVQATKGNLARLASLPDSQPVVGPTLAHRAWRILASLSVGRPQTSELREAAVAGFGFAVVDALLKEDPDWVRANLEAMIVAAPEFSPQLRARLAGADAESAR